MCGVNAVTSINDSERCRPITSVFGTMPSTQFTRNDSQASPRSCIDCKALYAITGINTFSCNAPFAPANAKVVSFPITCAHTIVTASHWVGFTFPGIIELPGSISGNCSSPRPHRGPEASHRMSFAILKRATANVFSAPLALTTASRHASASNAFGARWS